MQNLKVFLVEDDEIYSMILAQKLKVFGNFFVSTFSSGESALEHLGKQPEIDIVILDYDLPGLSGLETLSRIQQMAHRAKVLFLSGVDEREVVEQCMRSGAYEFIRKDKEVASKVYVAINRIMAEGNKGKRKKGLLGGFMDRLRGE